MGKGSNERAGGGGAAAVLRDRFDVVLREAERVLDKGAGSARRVHRLRVATRRARSAVDALGAAGKRGRAERAAKWLKRTRRSAERVRSCDVEAAFLEGLRSELSGPERDGAGFVLGVLAERRVSAAAALERDVRERLLGKLRSSAGKLVKSAGDDEEELRRALGGLVVVAGERVRESGRGVGEDLDSLHGLRIAVKKARYAVELAEPVAGGGRCAAVLGRLERLQERLGEINDLHELAARLVGMEKLAGKRAPGLADGVEALRARVERRRDGLADAFRGGWDAGETEGLAESVAGLLGGSGRPDMVVRRSVVGRISGTA